MLHKGEMFSRNRSISLDRTLFDIGLTLTMLKSLATQLLSALTLSAMAAVTLESSVLAAPYVVEKTHTLTTGTYLGGNGDDQARGAVFMSNGDPIVAGNFALMQTPGKVRQVGLGATQTQPGKVLHLTADGKVAIEMTLGNRVDSMAITPGGNRLVVGGDFGIVMLDPTTLKVLWSQPLTGLAVGNGMTDGGQTHGLDANTLKEKWRTWDFDPSTLGKDMADSRMYRLTYRLTIAPTGEPIVLGESAGGNSVFRWNGKNLTTEPRVKTDVYSDTYNSKSNHMLYFAKLNPKTGIVKQVNMSWFV